MNRPSCMLLVWLVAVVGCSSSGASSRLGRECSASCPPGGICASVGGGCDPDQLCISRSDEPRAYCSVGCTLDVDCGGGGPSAEYLCTKGCNGDTILANQCLAFEDAISIECRQRPPATCLTAIPDGICDDRSGFCPDGTDDRDCAGPDEPTRRCAVLCPQVRASACPSDDLAGCETNCAAMIAGFKQCATQAYAWMECDAATANTCTAEGRTDSASPPCAAQSDAYRTCLTAP